MSAHAQGRPFCAAPGRGGVFIFSSSARRKLLQLAFFFCLSLAARAYVHRTDASNVYVVKWYSSPVSMQLKLSATASFSDGTSQSSTVVAAMNAWNAELGLVQLTPEFSTPGGYQNGNGINEIVMDSTIGGMTFPAGALAVTMVYARGDEEGEADMVFNTAYRWDSYRGNLRSGIQDLRRVAMHELGHVLGLLHPDEKGQFVTAVMNSHISNIDALQLDDITGARVLYGAPGITAPANDHFADAAAIMLASGPLVLTTNNLAADREDGEPDHAGSTGRHSVWWKWTAASNGTITATTLGSNFDTALAVYTGSNLPELNLVAGNDDEETPEQNPNPNRKRTSLVSFDAMAGTTYYFAVDGFGSSRTPANGYTGSITLNLNFAAKIPPTIASHPSTVTVRAGDVVYFGIAANGTPAPSYEWQRFVGGVWSRLSEGSSYQGVATAALRVVTTFAMDGDQFRCVVSNSAGTTTSNAATLHVTPFPLPTIATQPRNTSVLAGENARLSVEASGAASYQWYHNGLLIAGQTGAVLLFNPAQSSDAGSYYVVVTNPGGSVTSASVTLSVGAAPTIALVSARRQVRDVGQTAEFSVSAAGTGTLSYQWYHDGRPISGAVGASLSRVITGDRDGGAYWVSVSDSTGTRASAPSFVIVSHALTNVYGWGPEFIGDAPMPPASLITTVAVSLGWDSAAALKSDGTIAQWGYVGFPGILPAGINDAVAISVGRGSAAVLKSDGTVIAIGDAAAVPPGLNKVCAVACAASFALALKTDGTVTIWGDGGRAPVPAGLSNVVAIAAGSYHALAVKADGTVVSWSDSSGVGPAPAGLGNVVAVAGGIYHSLALKADGTVVAWGDNTRGQLNMPERLSNVVAISAGSYHSLALRADGTVFAWGENLEGNSTVPAGLNPAFAIAAGGHNSYIVRETRPTTAPIVTVVKDQEARLGETTTLVTMVNVTADLQWQRDGAPISGANGNTLKLTNLSPASTGLYFVRATAGGVTTTTDPIVVGLPLSTKVVGQASEVGVDIVHTNGNVYDQVLLQGPAATFTADTTQKQVTRLSYVDLTDDIVQVEFSGPGSVSLVLDGATGPAPAANYNQPTVSYMKGQAGIVITGANSTTNLSIFSVGKATAVNQSLFKDGVVYDGIADLAYIAISSPSGTFGGLRAANASFFATKGFTGVYAPGIQFTGPVFVGDINAQDNATPVLRLAGSTDVQINGGNLSQSNGRAVQVSGIAQLKFVGGTKSDGTTLSAKTNQARLEQNGVDVTNQVVVPPSP